jgi:hypothetical protein
MTSTRSINISFNGWHFNNVELNNPDSIGSDVTQITITTLQNRRGFRVSFFDNETHKISYRASNELIEKQDTKYDLTHDQEKTTTWYENKWRVGDQNEENVKYISTPNFISTNYSFNPQRPRDNEDDTTEASLALVIPSVASACYFFVAINDTNLKHQYAHITAATLCCFAFILLPIVYLVFETYIKSWWTGGRDQFDFSNKLITVVTHATRGQVDQSKALDVNTAPVFKPLVHC